MTELLAKSTVRIPDYTLKEEVFNTFSHAAGAVFGTAALLIMGRRADTPKEMFCAVVYGLSILLLYGMSALYHNEPPASPRKARMRYLDHGMVFVLVFGTCTPVFLLGVGGRLGTALFESLCFMTLAGIALTIRDMDRYEPVCTAIHLINGWSVILGARALAANMGTAGMLWLLAGGLMYTVGVLFFALGAKVRYMHGVFHVFCLLGTALQFAGICGTLL